LGSPCGLTPECGSSRHLAQLHLNAGDSQTAAEYAGQALEMNPNIAEASLIRGSALANMRNYAAAAADLEITSDEIRIMQPACNDSDWFISRSGEPPRRRRSLRLLWPGIPARRTPLRFPAGSIFPRESSKGTAAGQPGYQRQPEASRVLRGAGQIFLSMKDMARAEEAYVRAVEVDPKNAEQRQVLADFYASTGQLDKSIAILQAIMSEDPSNSVPKTGLPIFT